MKNEQLFDVKYFRPKRVGASFWTLFFLVSVLMVYNSSTYIVLLLSLFLLSITLINFYINWQLLGKLDRLILRNEDFFIVVNDEKNRVTNHKSLLFEGGLIALCVRLEKPVDSLAGFKTKSITIFIMRNGNDGGISDEQFRHIFMCVKTGRLVRSIVAQEDALDDMKY